MYDSHVIHNETQLWSDSKMYDSHDIPNETQ